MLCNDLPASRVRDIARGKTPPLHATLPVCGTFASMREHRLGWRFRQRKGDVRSGTTQ